jgi:hypothetical protein
MKLLALVAVTCAALALSASPALADQPARNTQPLRVSDSFCFEDESLPGSVNCLETTFLFQVATSATGSQAVVFNRRSTFTSTLDGTTLFSNTSREHNNFLLAGDRFVLHVSGSSRSTGLAGDCTFKYNFVVVNSVVRHEGTSSGCA